MHFKPVADSLDEVHLLEASTRMREAQIQRLCSPGHIEKDDDGKPIGAFLLPAYSSHPVKVKWFDRMEDLTAAHTNQDSTPDTSVTERPWPIIFAHEFFDALPTHRFRVSGLSEDHREEMVAGVCVPQKMHSRGMVQEAEDC